METREKIITGIAAFALIALAFSFIYETDKTPAEVIKKVKTEKKREMTKMIHQKTLENEAIKAVDAASKALKSNTEKDVTVREPMVIEPFTDSEDQIDVRASRANIEPATSFHIDISVMRSLISGDVFPLPEMDNDILELEVVSVKEEESGLYRISAKPLNQEENSHDFAIITLGKTTASFSIRQDGKQYSGRSINGGGYFYRTSDIVESTKDKRIKTDQYYPPVKDTE